MNMIAPSLAPRLHNVNFIFIAPFVVCCGIWPLDRSDPSWYRVPLITALLHAVSTILGAIWSTQLARRGLSRPAAGSFSLLVPLSNSGHLLAGFITLLLLGEAAYPYNAICLVSYTAFFVLVWLPMARHWGHGGKSFGETLQLTLRSPQASVLAGLIAGGFLNAYRVPMAHGWVVLLKWMVFAGTAIVMFGVGTRLHFRRMAGYTALMVRLFAVKFLIHPIITVLLCLLFGIHGLPAGALLIISFMPVGTYAVALATIFDLDVDLANAGYLWSTAAFMTLVFPIVLLLLRLPMFH